MTQMLRRADWPERLMAYLDAHQDAPFQWGVHDCVLFAAGAIEAVTGIDPAAKFRGKPGAGGVYKTPRGALGALRRLAGGGVAEMADKMAADLGFPAVAPSLARRGDVALIAVDEGGPLPHALAVVLGPHALAPRLGEAPVGGGLVRVPISQAVSAWAVGW